MADATRLAVVGCGTMGAGIAAAAVAHGMAVLLHDVDPAAMRRLAMTLTSGTDGPPPDVRLRDSIAAVVADADVAVESVPEVVELKAAVLREIGAHAPPGCLVSTNTSTMSIAMLAARSGTEGRLIGIHFFNPADRLRLVEIVRSPGTPPEVVARAERFGGALGKTPIVVRDQPGFVTSRLGLVLGNEAMRLLAEGVATTTAIDTAMRLGYNHPMGPLELADLVGLDARLNNLRSLYEASGEQRFQPPAILVAMVGNDYLGRKSSRGFYYYDENGRKTGEAPVPLPTVPSV